MALSIGFRDSVSFLLTIQATGVLTFTLVGLLPTEYASLRWTHQHAGLSRRTPTKPAFCSSPNLFAWNPARQAQLLEQFLRDRVFGQLKFSKPSLTYTRPKEQTCAFAPRCHLFLSLPVFPANLSRSGIDPEDMDTHVQALHRFLALRILHGAVSQSISLLHRLSWRRWF